MDQVLNEIPEPTLPEEVIVDMKAAKEGKHTAYFHRYPKAVADHSG